MGMVVGIGLQDLISFCILFGIFGYKEPVLILLLASKETWFLLYFSSLIFDFLFPSIFLLLASSARYGFLNSFHLDLDCLLVYFLDLGSLVVCCLD